MAKRINGNILDDDCNGSLYCECDSCSDYGSGWFYMGNRRYHAARLAHENNPERTLTQDDLDAIEYRRGWIEALVDCTFFLAVSACSAGYFYFA